MPCGVQSSATTQYFIEPCIPVFGRRLADRQVDSARLWPLPLPMPKYSSSNTSLDDGMSLQLRGNRASDEYIGIVHFRVFKDRALGSSDELAGR